MSKTCRFKSTYVRSSSTYTASFKGLTKLQLTLLRSLLHSLSCDGVVYVYDKGFTMPYLQCSCQLPLLLEGNVSRLPFSALYSLASLCGCKDLPTKDVSIILKK